MICNSCFEDKKFTGWTELDTTPKVDERTWRESLNEMRPNEKPAMLMWNVKPWNRPIFICKSCKETERRRKWENG